MQRFLNDYGIPLAFGPALASLLGSLYYSEVAGFVPCTLCWYQRILMYPLVVIILVGFLRDDSDLPRYVLPLSVGGMLVSTYHVLLQNGIVGGTALCRAGIPCNVRYVNYLGFITIPVMALTAFTLISFLMAGALWSQGDSEPAPEY